MKKVRVVKRYSDKFTKVIHHEGEELSLTDERADELAAILRVVIIDEEGEEIIKTSIAKDISSENIKPAVKENKEGKQTKEEKSAKATK